MKKLIALAGLMLALGASAQVKVVSVNTEKVYTEHYKTQEFRKDLQTQQTGVQERIQEMQKEGQALVDTLRSQVEQAQNTALTEAARKQAEEDAKRTNQQVEQKREALQRFVNQSQQMFNERITNHRLTLMDEIKLAVGEVARRRNASLAVDATGRLNTGAQPLLWAASMEEVTDEVIAEVNKGRPKTTP